MGLTSIDRNLLNRVLAKETGSWNDFVDRFIGLVYHTIQYTAYARSVPLGSELVEDMAEEVFRQFSQNDYELLRRFRGHSSLSAYLTVAARRIGVHELLKFTSDRKPLPSDMNRNPTKKSSSTEGDGTSESEALPKGATAGLESLEKVEALLPRLGRREREMVRMYFIEGRTYEEISTLTKVPVKLVGQVVKKVRELFRPPASKKKSKPEEKSGE